MVSFGFFVCALVVSEFYKGYDLVKYHIRECQIIREFDTVPGISYTLREGNAFWHQDIQVPLSIRAPTDAFNYLLRVMSQNRVVDYIEPEMWRIFNPVVFVAGDRKMVRIRPFAKYIRNLTYLQRVDLGSANGQQELMLSLKNARFLRELYLEHNDFSDEALAIVAQVRNLEKLDASVTSITDKGVEYLRGHPSLSNINLSSTDITDRCLSVFITIPNLKSLSLSYTKINPDGARLNQLRKKMPHLEIDFFEID